jgi:F-type H+-transporting ATPase subunit epsilon
MAKIFQLEIIACDRLFYKGDCEILVFPGIDGEHGILANHEAMVTYVNAGELKFQINGVWQYAVVSAGFVEITPTRVVLLADTVERPEEIDINRASEAKKRAEEQLRQKLSIREYYNTKAAMNRAMARLKITSKHKEV